MNERRMKQCLYLHIRPSRVMLGFWLQVPGVKQHTTIAFTCVFFFGIKVQLRSLLQNGVEGRARDPTHSRRINRKKQATPYFERRVTPTSSHHRILVPWPSLQLQSILLDPVGSDAWPLIGLGSDVDTQMALKPFTLLVKCNTKSWVCIP